MGVAQKTGAMAPHVHESRFSQKVAFVKPVKREFARLDEELRSNGFQPNLATLTKLPLIFSPNAI